LSGSAISVKHFPEPVSITTKIALFLKQSVSFLRKPISIYGEFIAVMSKTIYFYSNIDSFLKKSEQFSYNQFLIWVNIFQFGQGLKHFLGK
jgi:hypothetical protein